MSYKPTNGGLCIDWLEYDRGTWRRGVSAHDKLSHAVRALRKADGFSGALDWGTVIVSGLTLEELVCAVLHGEYELRNLEQAYHSSQFEE